MTNPGDRQEYSAAAGYTGSAEGWQRARVQHGRAIAHYGILDSGAPFLQKPFLPEALARKLREVLTSSALAG